MRWRRASEGFDLSAIPCLGGGLGRVGLGLDRLVQGLDVLLHVLALVLVLEPERLVLHDLLLLGQVGLRRLPLLRRHPDRLLLSRSRTSRTGRRKEGSSDGGVLGFGAGLLEEGEGRGGGEEEVSRDAVDLVPEVDAGPPERV
jgi:hypothetical protein